MSNQISLFDGETKFKIDKPIRLLEMFGGYGSQSLSLKYLGVPFTQHLLSEWAVPSIQAYRDLHYGEDNTDYSASLSDLEIVDWLDGRISANYCTPMTRKQIEKHNGGEKWRRKVYNNMKASKNLGSIMKIKGQDLGIVDTDKYCYVLTYSFPCQDISSAGKGAGMEKGSGTRSGLLWEVERLLTETKELPQVLLMENVPEVVGKKNMPQFAKWLAFLDELGYKTKWDILNAKDFGIPQNRARCFAVSVLGDYYYDMPRGFPLKKRLKDVLEKNVDESYYLKEETIQALNIHKERNEAKATDLVGNLLRSGYAHTVKTESAYKADSNFIVEKTRTLLLSNQGKQVEKFTEVANTIMARDYKGFGNQPMNAVMEISPPPHTKHE